MKTELNILEQTNIMRFPSAFTKEQSAEISKQILAYKDLTAQQQTPDSVMMLNNNKGCWMGRPQESSGFTAEVDNLLITTLLDACNSYVTALPKPANIDNLNTNYLNKSAWFLRAWCNVNDPGSENFPHLHSGHFMSGVVWFQGQGTGILEFIPNNYLYKLTHPAWPYHGTSSYYPEDGDIVIFPSYLLHRVQRNESTKQRISMAFNVTLTDQDYGQDS